MAKNWHNGITYVQPGDREAWVDFPEPRKQPPTWMSDAVHCGICRGYGGWNLLLGAFPLTRDNTAENRHEYSHMKATCHGCAGHGWVKSSDRQCVHEYRWAGVSDRLTHFSCVHCKSAVSWDVRRKR